MTLSLNAEKLLTAIKANSINEMEAVKVLFPEPKYIGTLDPNFDTETKIAAQKTYWQWDVNFYGRPHSRPVNGEHIDFEPTANYDAMTYEAIKELKAAGLIRSANMGYNTYCYHYIKSACPV